MPRQKNETEHPELRSKARTCAFACALSVALSLLLSAMELRAQSGSASYQIPRQTIDGGAGEASSASYRVSGSIGQADASTVSSSTSFRLQGGFQRANSAAPPMPEQLFANGFE
jgi:hypothetical protein